MGNIIYSFKEVCDRTGYKPTVIRYYEKEFKLNIPRDINGRRYFTEKELDDFLFIKQLQEKGYTNSQIKKVLEDRLCESLNEIAVTSEEAMFIQEVVPVATTADEGVIKYIDEKLSQINNNLQELSQTVTSKERDVILSENLKLKMEIKKKSYEIMQLKEKLTYEKEKKGSFFSRLFGRR
jgi:DNA-binding transcriptional MerR regulator